MPDLDEQIAAVRIAQAPGNAPTAWFHAMRAAIATLEASRPAPPPNGKQGDAERLAELREQVGRKTASLLTKATIIEFFRTDAEFIFEQLDAARSALAESQSAHRAAMATINAMSRKFCDDGAANRAEIARLEAEIARLTAALAESQDYTKTLTEAVQTQSALIKRQDIALATARAQGVREGIEQAAQLVETHIEGNSNGERAISPKAGISRGSINGRAYAAAIRALAPEPQPGTAQDASGEGGDAL